MQIFRLHENPEKNARMYPDKYTYNQIRESALAMFTAVQIEGGEAPYGMTHEHHPITQWLRYRDNWLECREITEACNEEYKRRYGNGDHASWLEIEKFEDFDVLKDGGTLQPCAFQDKFKIHMEPRNLSEVVENYRNYVKVEKQRHSWFKYVHGEKPDFLKLPKS